MQTILDKYPVEKLEPIITNISEMLEKGIHEKRIREILKIKDFNELYSIALARLKNRRTRKTHFYNLYMSPDDLRFATNDLVAEYRASRLRCNTIIDIGCGIGLQSFAFSKTCKKVYAIEIDERKIRYAKENARLLGIENIEFVHGDALELASSLKADIVFCETERAATEQQRSFERLKPRPYEVVKAYSHLTDKFCIEVPPQIRNIEMDCEKEYVSINHELNRLNLYFGALKKCDVSAVLLPFDCRLENNKKRIQTSSCMRYLYEPDEAVAKAGLLAEIPVKEVFFCPSYGMLTSETRLQSPFFKASFELLHKCRKRFEEIVRLLKKEGCGKVVLRTRIEPERYWTERKRYEKILKGQGTLYLFSSDNEALICRKL